MSIWQWFCACGSKSCIVSLLSDTKSPLPLMTKSSLATMSWWDNGHGKEVVKLRASWQRQWQRHWKRQCRWSGQPGVMIILAIALALPWHLGNCIGIWILLQWQCHGRSILAMARKCTKPNCELQQTIGRHKSPWALHCSFDLVWSSSGSGGAVIPVYFIIIRLFCDMMQNPPQSEEGQHSVCLMSQKQQEK